MRERVAALRRDVERDTVYSAEEHAALDAARFARIAGSYAEQRRAFERETAIVRGRQQRFDAAMRERLAAFRAELPALHRRIRERQMANDAVRRELQRLEDAQIESNARTQAALAASRSLDALAAAPLSASLRSPIETLDDPARVHDVLRTIALLTRAMPRAAFGIAV